MLSTEEDSLESKAFISEKVKTFLALLFEYNNLNISNGNPIINYYTTNYQCGKSIINKVNIWLPMIFDLKLCQPTISKLMLIDW